MLLLGTRIPALKNQKIVGDGSGEGIVKDLFVSPIGILFYILLKNSCENANTPV